MGRRAILVLLFALAAAGCASSSRSRSTSTGTEATVRLPETELRDNPWKLPGETRADSALQVNALQGVYRLDDMRMERCDRRRLVDTDVVEKGTPSPGTPGARWVERWTLDRCGTRVAYRVEFAPTSEGATGFTIRFD